MRGSTMGGVDVIDLATAGFDEWVCVENHRPSDPPAGSWLPAIQLIAPETLIRRVDHTHEVLLAQRHEGKAGHGHEVPAADGPVAIVSHCRQPNWELSPGW